MPSKKLIVLIFILLTLLGTSYANHIAGGEFKLTYISGDSYSLQMRFFRDCSPNNPTAFDPGPLVVGIYDKQKDSLITTFNLPVLRTYSSTFNNSNCVTSNICIDVREYKTTITLPRSRFNNLKGYYLSWERCCRNQGITNIDQSVEPAGFVFYMEIPSPYPGNTATQFVNNSPEFKKDPLALLCLDKAFSFNFNVVDADGDKLVYSLVDPLKGNTSQTATNNDNTFTMPGPYAPVDWNAGYNANACMRGNPELTIDSTGLLTVTPKDPGTFALCVLVEEYRNGVRIGEVRRELELFVYVCNDDADSDPPVVSSPDGNKLFIFNTNTANCFDASVVDPENDKVTVSIVSSPIDVNSYGAKVKIDSAGTPTNIHFCWTPDCTVDTSSVITISLLVNDNHSCPQDQNIDTVSFQVKVKRFDDVKPSTTLLSGANASFKIGSNSCVEIQVDDPNENDLIVTSVSSSPIDIFSMGATYTPNAFKTDAGPIKGKLCWTPPCSQSPGQKIDLRFITTDNSQCPAPKLDTLYTSITLTPVLNTKPELKLQSESPDSTYYITVGKEMCIPLLASDVDGDSLSFTVKSIGYDIFADGATIKSGTGRGSMQPSLCWKPSCAIDTAKMIRILAFLNERDVLCSATLSDTVSFKFKPVSQPNSASKFTLPSIDSFVYLTGVKRCTSIDIKDADNDSITLENYIEEGATKFKQGGALNSVGGIGAASINVCWDAPCSIDTAGRVKITVLAVQHKELCNLAVRDSVVFYAKVKQPVNSAPELTRITPQQALLTTLGQNKCIEFESVDADADSIDIDFIEQEYDILNNGGTFSPTKGVGKVKSTLCWTPTCFIDRDSVYVKVLIKDRGRPCMNRMVDTVGFYIPLKKPVNEPPAIVLDHPGSNFVFELGKAQCIKFKSQDSDSDSIHVKLYPTVFDIFDKGAQLIDGMGRGDLKSTLCWTPPCNLDTLQTIKIDAVVNDLGRACIRQKTDTISFSIKLKQGANTSPVVSASKPGKTIKLILGQQNSFFVTGQDKDLGDNLRLITTFDPDIRKLNAVFPDSLKGIRYVSDKFSWTPPCDWDTLKSVKMRIIVDDQACGSSSFDTLNLKLDVIPQPNTKPRFANLTSTYTVLAGEQLKFDMNGEDAEGDSMQLTVKSELSVGFDTLGNTGLVASGFDWKTECKDVRKDPYELVYKLREFGCAKKDTNVHRVLITVIPNGDYLIPTIFTPNSDGFNDALKVMVALPEQKPGKYFFRIYNRWGDLLFEADSPAQEWRAENIPDGVYVYFLDAESCPRQQTGLITIKH